MSSLAQTGWLTQALSLLPAQLHRSLDAWSHRLALQRAQQRRQSSRPPAGPDIGGFAEYKLRPWRD